MDGHVRMGIAEPAADIDRGFAIVASLPRAEGQADRHRRVRPGRLRRLPATVYPQNGYRNGTLYSSYTAASFARKHDLAEQHGVNFEGALTWAFEFEDQPLFAGFRVLATNGIDLPVLNVFRMFGLMGGGAARGREHGRRRRSTRSCSDGVRGKPDVVGARQPARSEALRPGLALPRRRPARPGRGRRARR